MKNKYIDYFIFLITAVYTFFSYIKYISNNVNIHFMYIILISVLIILKLTQKNIKIKISYLDFVWVIYLMFLCFNEFFITDYKTEGLQYLIYNFIIYFLHLSIENTNEMDFKGLNIVYCFSKIHVYFIILQLIFTNIIMKLNYYILQSGSYKVIETALNNNYYSGITLQPAAAGLFSTIFVAIVFTKIISKSDTQIKTKIELGVGVIALLLTQKRAFLVATLIAIVFIYIFYNVKKRNTMLKIFKIGIVGSLVLVLVFTCIPATRNIMQKLIKQENFMSGRENLYSSMIEWFGENPIWGKGIGTAGKTFGYGGHNIYLQTLAETGIIGFAMLYTILFYIFIRNMKVSKRIITKNENKLYHSILLYSLYMQIVLFVYGLTGNPIYDYTFYVNFIIAMALPIAIKRRCDNQDENKCSNTCL